MDELKRSLFLVGFTTQLGWKYFKYDCRKLPVIMDQLKNYKFDVLNYSSYCKFTVILF